VRAILSGCAPAKTARTRLSAPSPGVQALCWSVLGFRPDHSLSHVQAGPVLVVIGSVQASPPNLLGQQLGNPCASAICHDPRHCSLLTITMRFLSCGLWLAPAARMFSV